MNASTIKVLLIDGSSKFARVIGEMLRQGQGAVFVMEWAESLDQAERSLQSGPFDVVLFDLALNAEPGWHFIGVLRKHAPHLPVIVLSTQEDEELAIQAVHAGAQDYLLKTEITNHLLNRSLRYSLERKRSEAALRQAEDKYRSIYEHTVEGIFQTTPDGRYLSANPALARIYGYESPEKLIEGLTDIQRDLYVEPGRRAEFVKLMEQHDVVAGFESRIYRRDRSIIWIAENVRAVRDASGQLLYYEGTVTDITERKRSEEELRNSETLYHSLVETLPQFILRKNLQEQFTFANQRFCQALGRPLHEILGKTDFDFFPAELAAAYQKDDQQVMESGIAIEKVEENQPPGGEKRYVNVVKTPLYDAQGRIIGLQGIFWDITEKRRAEEGLKKLNRDLAESQEALRQKNEEMAEDLRMAREIQLAILPQQYPCFPHTAAPADSLIQFCHRYLPSGEVGGDFFYIQPISDTRAGIFIGDVMGHGVRSALVTAILRALLEELEAEASDPAALLAGINRELRAILRPSGAPLYTTAFYMMVDLAENQLTYANAGHPKPLLIRRPAGTVEFIQNAAGKGQPALGLFDHASYTNSSIRIGPTDAVVLFTDGVYDVEKDGELLSPEWFRQAVAARHHLPLAVALDEILADLKSYSGGQFPDDLCLVGTELCQK